MTKTKIRGRILTPIARAQKYRAAAENLDEQARQKIEAANLIDDMIHVCEQDENEEANSDIAYWIHALRVSSPTLRASAETDTLTADDLRAAEKRCLLSDE